MVGLSAALASCTGNHRTSNQDSAAASPRVAFVADGVGGQAGGDIASWSLTHHLAAQLRSGAPEDLRRVLAGACWQLGARIRSTPELEGMSTTFTGILAVEDRGDGVDRLLLAHVGDSRAYRLRDGVLEQMTRDDSLVQLLVDAGHLAPEEAAGHPRRNVILAALGGSVDDADAVTLTEVDARPGDRWLLASDGLTDYVPLAVVDRHLRACTPRVAADALVLAGLGHDARDNVTVAVADVVRAGSGAPPRRSWQFAGAAADPRLGSVLDLAAPA